MDLYYAMTNYHLLCCVLHKLAFNKDNKAELWISSYLFDSRPDILGALESSSIFENVFIFKEIDPIYHGDAIVSKKTIEDELENIRNNIDKERLKELESFKDLYICQDTHSLGIYLNENKIEYNFFEDGCGTLHRPEMIIDLVGKQNPVIAQIITKLKCVGESANVVHRYGDLSEQVKGYSNKKDIDFSVKKILKTLSEEDIKKVLKIYNCKKFDLGKKKKSLLLTWPYYRFMTIDEHKEFFTLLADYFTDEKETLFIKPHPGDDRSNYEGWFNGAVVLSREMPSELLPFCVEGKFDKGITNWSTSIFGLKDVLNTIINFDKTIDDTYQDFHKYYAIVKLLDFQKDEKRIQRIKICDMNERQLIALMDYYLKDWDKYYQIVKGSSDIIVASRVNRINAGNKYILLNTMDYKFDNLLKVRSKNGTEYIYLYNIFDVKLNMKKKMRFSGDEVRISSSSILEYVKGLEEKIKLKNEEIVKLQEENKKVADEKNIEIERLNVEIKGMVESSSWRVTKPLRKIKAVLKGVK